MTLAPGLRTFLKIMSVLGFAMPLSLFLTSIYTLFGYNFFAPVGNYLRNAMLIASQLIDFTALIVSIDCLIASFTQKKNPFLTAKYHGYFASGFCVFISFCIAGAYYFSSYFVHVLFLFTTSTHVICLVTEVTLLIINIRRHKIISSNYSLSVRHKLVRNINVLRVLCPVLFLVTIFSASGTIPSFFYLEHKVISLAVGIQLVYSCYNAAFLSVIVIFIWKCYKQTKRIGVADINGGEERTVSHFQQLKKSWQ
uniref:G_PROTEIN_RECEP_F1_2 domain-containing protein n=1 Tax=Panagrellus redivivus TaxID=6233 RepID=A0A7E4UVX8_PANRE